MKHHYAREDNPRELRQDRHDYRSDNTRESFMPGYGTVPLRARDYRCGFAREHVALELEIIAEDAFMDAAEAQLADELDCAWENHVYVSWTHVAVANGATFIG